MPFESFSHSTKKQKQKMKKNEEKNSLQRQSEWEHKALSGSDSAFYVSRSCNQSNGKLQKTGAYQQSNA